MSAWIKTAVQPRLTFPTLAGSIVTFNSQYAGLPLKSHKIALTATQSGSGTPSPDNVRTINGYNALNISATGKNLVNFTARTVTSQARIIDNLYLNKGDYRFTISIINNTAINGVFAIRIGTTNIKTVGFNGNFEGVVSTTFNLTENSVINITLGGASAGYSFDISDAQIEIGTQSTDYEPYNGSFTTIQIGSTVYGGEYDARTGVLTVTYGYYDLGNIDSWTYYTSGDNPIFYSAIPLDGKIYSLNEDIDCICSEYNPYPTAISRANLARFLIDKQFGFIYGNLNIAIRDDDYTDDISFKSAMSGVYICYKLANPTTIQLPPCPIDTLEGVNNIWADTGDTTLQYTKFG